MEKRKIYIAPVTEVSEMSLMLMALGNREHAFQSYSIVKRKADGTFKHMERGVIWEDRDPVSDIDAKPSNPDVWED